MLFTTYGRWSSSTATRSCLRRRRPSSYLDLAYQLSLAGEAKHSIRRDRRRWPASRCTTTGSGTAHGHDQPGRTTSICGGGVLMAVPALCAAAIVHHRRRGLAVSGRPYVGALAAALSSRWASSTSPPVTERSPSVRRSVRRLARHVDDLRLGAAHRVIAPLARSGRRRAFDPRVSGLGRGAFALAGLLLFESSGAKASSLPVIAVALLLTALVRSSARRRIPWASSWRPASPGPPQLVRDGGAVPVPDVRGPHRPPAGAASGLDARVELARGGRRLGARSRLNMLLRTAGIVPLCWAQPPGAGTVASCSPAPSRAGLYLHA